MLISSSDNLCVFYSFRKKDKLVALLVYSSFPQVATSGIRNSSAAFSGISQRFINRAHLKSEHGVILFLPQHCSTV